MASSGSPDQTTAIAAALGSSRFRVRLSTLPDGSTTWIYGDRNQYNKLATLLTHAGLVLFLVTLLLNVIALSVVRRYREQYE